MHCRQSSLNNTLEEKPIKLQLEQDKIETFSWWDQRHQNVRRSLRAMMRNTNQFPSVQNLQLTSCTWHMVHGPRHMVVCNEEVSEQAWSHSLLKEEPETAHIKEEPENTHFKMEPEPPHIKEEQQERCLSLIKEEPESSHTEAEQQKLLQRPEEHVGSMMTLLAVKCEDDSDDDDDEDISSEVEIEVFELESGSEVTEEITDSDSGNNSDECSLEEGRKRSYLQNQCGSGGSLGNNNISSTTCSSSPGKPAPSSGTTSANRSASSRKRLAKDSGAYKVKREQNNAAVRKSRGKAKVRKMETQHQVLELEAENAWLQNRFEQLSSEVTTLRNILSAIGKLTDSLTGQCWPEN